MSFTEGVDPLLTFLADNPNEVLLLYIEDYVWPKPLTDALVATGLAAYAHTYDRANPATLGYAPPSHSY